MEPERSELFQGLVARTIRALERRGLSVLPAAVASVIDGLIASAVERTGISPAEALHLAEPEQIAELITLAGRDERQASVRPLREDKLQALSQAAKMAVTNGDTETAVHAADLLSEFGAGITNAAETAQVGVERGVLSETAQILDRVAEAFETVGWSTCPCGEDHGQKDLDRGLPKVFRADADMARQMLVTNLAEDG